jgi:hypothetical protein
VAKVRIFHSTFPLMKSHILLHCRKILGDSDKDTAATPKKLRITTQSTYRLMRKQALQAGSSAGEPEQEVCIGGHLENPNH